MTVVQIGGLVLALASPWANAVADAAAWAAHLAATGLIHSSSLVDFAPWLSASVPPPVWWLMALYYAAALGLLSTRTRWMSGWILAAAAGVLLAGPRQTSRDAMPPGRSPVRVVVLDVGQGDATVIELPGGREAPRRYGWSCRFSSAEPENSMPTPFLRPPVLLFRLFHRPPLFRPSTSASASSRRRCARSGFRVCTRSRSRTAIPITLAAREAFCAASRRRACGRAYLSLHTPVSARSPRWLRRTASTWRTVQADDAERFGSAEVRVLHPPRPEWERQRVRNEDSIVIEVRIGAVSIVLPGDIGREAERADPADARTRPPDDPEGPAPRQRDIEHAGIPRRTRPAAVIFSCRPGKPIRPPASRGGRALSGDRQRRSSGPRRMARCSWRRMARRWR